MVPAFDANSITYHPLCSMFPKVEGEEFEQLVESIKQTGLLEPITVLPHRPEETIIVIDGANRLRACIEAGIDPRPFVTLHPKDDETDEIAPSEDELLEFVMAKNIARRNLTPTQRAFLVAEAKKVQTAKHGGDRTSAKWRRTDANRMWYDEHELDSLTSDEIEVEAKPLCDTAAAELAGVSRKTMHDAVVVAEKGHPELKEAVRKGEISIQAAKQIAELPAEQQKETLAEGPKQAAKKVSQKTFEKSMKAFGLSSAKPTEPPKGSDASNVPSNDDGITCGTIGSFEALVSNWEAANKEARAQFLDKYNFVEGDDTSSKARDNSKIEGRGKAAPGSLLKTPKGKGKAK